MMPLMILAAKICPPGVEATLFSLLMGLSNFGGTVGYYVGQGMLTIIDVQWIVGMLAFFEVSWIVWMLTLIEVQWRAWMHRRLLC